MNGIVVIYDFRLAYKQVDYNTIYSCNSLGVLGFVMVNKLD